MKSRTILKSLLILVVALVLAAPALAGGWAVVTVGELPGEVRAGESVRLDFTVLQHGERPIHNVDFMNNDPLTPYLTARNTTTGETFQMNADRAEEVGRFTLEVTFPSEGEWVVQLFPAPLEGVTEFPLSVMAPAAASTVADPAPAAAVAPSQAEAAPVEAASAPAATTTTTASPARNLLRWGGLVFLLAAAVAGMVVLNNQRKPAEQIS